ncbi:Ppx/GppA phosphatase family protein [Weissella soli]|uniref:Ppx/GppA phosphatase family protein n=1 Tax=Weissella soli TaxID=155866 RepID=UPI001F2A1C45|nr:HD domain-containing protein [Weissella soli]GJM47751.1 exopolyphosphatase [Weissella soli]
MATKPLFGLILVGATTLDLQIINRKSGKVLERAHRSTIMSDELYSEGFVPQEQIQNMGHLLNGFKQLLADYGVETFKVFGSTTLANAHNAIYVLAQLQTATGLKITWLSASQEAYYRQISMRYTEPLFPVGENKNVFLISLSSGRLSLGYYQGDEQVFSRSVNLGAVKLASELDELADDIVDIKGITREFIHSKLADYTTLLPKFEDADLLLVSGSFALEQILAKPVVSVTSFFAANNEILGDPTQSWLDQLRLTASQVDAVMPELLLLEEIARMTRTKKVGVSHQHMLHGLILEELGQLDNHEILEHARELGQRFGVEPKHQAAVLKFAEQLFDRLKALHGLHGRERLLLQVAALVHDVGSYLNTYHHYEYSEMVILADEMDGLSPVEVQMVAIISRYHSHEVPGEGMHAVQQLNEHERIIVAQLTALLRLADALDDSRLQKIEKITVSTKDARVVVTGFSHEKLYLEQWTFANKANLFREVFGRDIILKRKGLQ